ncbi:MAG: 4-(cytidine 5'-diphospho)-2-C-methyl-D-erythritol kinase [Chloroflexi bacterium]|nr:4-(cytidine 5'-diphospho)-2-C-methyl-D-erythritol kinase [Chloroflexota bacterium]
MALPAFAKLNLTLEVLGRRPDGYHEVRTILQTIDLADLLTVRPADALQVQCDDPALDGEANIVWQAAAALAERKGVRPRALISIEKNIPVGMGLGGGSSDAATALLALNRMWGPALPIGELAQIAGGLGADVSFFLWGGAAVASGKGEEIQPLPQLPSTPVTLICPNATIPNKTASLYSALTPEHYSGGESTRRLAEILEAGKFVGDGVYNVFDEVAPQVFPELDGLRQRVSTLTNSRLHLSGSGPALFCIPSNEEEHLRVSNALQPMLARVYFVHTVSP